MPAVPSTAVWGALALLGAVLTSGCGTAEPPSSAATAAATTTTTAPATPRETTTIARPSTPTVDPYAGEPLIDRLEWTSNVDGPRLLIHPTRAGRDTTSPGADHRAWQEITTLDPGADSPGMWDQFRCHWEWARLIAPNKPTWNLEPWRPAVGYDATVDASCNPGGPER